MECSEFRAFFWAFSQSPTIPPTEDRGSGYEICLATSIPGPSRLDCDEDPGKIRFIVPKFWEKIACAVRHDRIQPYCNTVVSHCACDFFPKILETIK